jgi:hypothetical protein
MYSRDMKTYVHIKLDKVLPTKAGFKKRRERERNVHGSEKHSQAWLYEKKKNQ